MGLGSSWFFDIRNMLGESCSENENMDMRAKIAKPAVSKF